MEKQKLFNKTEVEEVRNSRQELSEFYVENWYPLLKHLSAKTVYLDFSIKEAKAILSFQKQRYKKMDCLTKEEIQSLIDLELKIDNMYQNEFNDTGFFIKFSFRSPKDGFPLDGERLTKYFKEEYDKMKKKWKPDTWTVKFTEQDIEGDMCWIAFARAFEQSLQCKSGKEALNIILSSDRAKEDITNAIEFEELNDEESLEFKNKINYKWDLKLILRRWINGINGTMEFRCFVKENIMTAITQYNHPFFIEELQSDIFCLELKTKIYDFWNREIRDLLKQKKNYVIDFAILDTDSSVFFIELNPYRDSCGTGMFHWVDDHDVLFGLCYDKNKSEIENIEFRTRRNQDIPYWDYWDTYQKYIMESIVTEEPYYKIFENIIK
jgi:hypothetical protein